MEKEAETLAFNDVGRNIEEVIISNPQGIPYIIYQKRISEVEASG